MKRMKKTVASILTAVVALSAVGFAGCSEEDIKSAFDDVKTSVSDFIDGTTENNAEEKPSVEDYDGTIVQDGETYPMLKAMAFTAPQAQATSTETETFTPVSVDLKATVEPSDANQNVVWSVEFVNSSSSWANGKNISEYMQVTQSSSSVSTGTVTCLKPFGEQIKITATSAENADISASCVVDFVKSIKSVSLTFGDDLPINLGGQTDVTLEINDNGVGLGGEAVVQILTYDDFTIDNTFEWDINLGSPDGVHGFYLGNDGIEPESGSTDWNSYYYWGGSNNLSTHFDEASNAYYTFDDNAYRDGYLIIAGKDCFVQHASSVRSLIFDWYNFMSVKKVSYYDGASSNEIFSETIANSNHLLFMGKRDSTIEERLSALTSIDNGYIWTCRLYIWGDTTGSFTYYDSLINLTGFTNKPVVKSISLESESLTF